MAKSEKRLRGVYFPKSKYESIEEIDAFMRELSRIALRYGYSTQRGPKAGGGNILELLEAIVGGEIALVLLPDEQRAEVIPWLLEAADAAGADDRYTVRDALRAIANTLLESLRREYPDGDDPWGLLE
ncbi:MAG: hypothetical protein D6698_08310 [Gammaproteobacteria bacterium]|nr:MAG: hypothetical protein D6698_08310 [Gammaproteobacteria bacterium]